MFLSFTQHDVYILDYTKTVELFILFYLTGAKEIYKTVTVRPIKQWNRKTTVGLKL